MRTTIDSAGRVVVPKPLRRDLGLAPGQKLEIGVREGHLEIAIPATPVALEEQDGVFVAVPAEPLPPLSADVVRDTLEQTRR